MTAAPHVTTTDNTADAIVDRVARAVLYEGYVLYPYRPSTKNRQRWTFGGLYPEAWCRRNPGADAAAMRCECLVHAPAGGRVWVKVRFLLLVQRTVGELADSMESLPPGGDVAYQPREAMEVGGMLYQSWQEAEAREVTPAEVCLEDLVRQPAAEPFVFPVGHRIEPLRGTDGRIVAVVARDRQPLEGSVELSASREGDNLFRLSVVVANRAEVDESIAASRDEALLRSLVSTHVVLHLPDGAGAEFVSLLDPPAPFADAAAGCRNVGGFPVLVGREGERHAMLCSPIILYDYPQVAPESPGDLFDAAEIDEILTLRIMTLTEEERRQAGATDERTRAMLARTDSLAREQLLGLHGTVRPLRPVESKPREADHG